VILQALTNYYEILLQDEESDIPVRYYSHVNVSYAVVLSLEGKVTNIIPLKIKDSTGKKEVPRPMIVPEVVIGKASGIKSDFLLGNAVYIFGLDNKGKPERAKQCFEAFKELHLSILKDVFNNEATAVKNFVSNWNTVEAMNEPMIKPYIDDLLKGGNIVFQYEGSLLNFIHENKEIKNAWEQYKSKNESKRHMQCLVTGEVAGISRLHAQVKGLKGGMSVGNALVSFNDRAYESYGKREGQGFNAPISEYAMFAYTTALQSLINDFTHKIIIGGTSVVFWAESSDKGYRDCISLFLGPEELNKNDKKDTYIRDESATRTIKEIFRKAADGRQINYNDDTFDKDTKIYIIGLAPNASRISLRFFMTDSFGGFIEKVGKHYQQMRIEKQYGNEHDFFSVWRLLSETVSAKSDDKSVSPLLGGAVMRSILTGTPYPAALYNAVLIRIRAERTINYYKTSIIKAYLIRLPRVKKNYEEVLTVSLNEKSNNKAYVLGRLFAVLEKAQEDANPGINATIKDRYFTSACCTPVSAFPVLLRLSNHHIAKSEYGYIIDKKIKELMEFLEIDNNPFPKNLSLEDQGIFILGYYHQKNAFYKKEEKEI